MTDFDFIVIGCGLSGAVIARRLAEEGNKVKIWDRRSHIGGNMYDYVDEYGVLVHKYGPHVFHTDNEKLLDYMSKFVDWSDYRICCGAEINGVCTPTPFNYKTIDDFYLPEKAEELKKRIEKSYPGRKTVTVLEVLASDDEMVRDYAKFLFDNDYSLYTAKQWGVSAEEIDPSVLKRVPLRFDYNADYFDDTYQVLPKTSYTDFFNHLLCHPNISVELCIEALDYICVDGEELKYRGKTCEFPVVYTGAIDELFGMKFGALPYRSLEFHMNHKDIESRQDMAIVAYPQEEGYTRIVEFKKMTPDRQVAGTTYEIEYPLPYKAGVKQEPYYPVLTESSMAQYQKYRELADKITNLYCCGRLADFKYYNMDQALERALLVGDMLIEKGKH